MSKLMFNVYVYLTSELFFLVIDGYRYHRQQNSEETNPPYKAIFKKIVYRSCWCKRQSLLLLQMLPLVLPGLIDIKLRSDAGAGLDCNQITRLACIVWKHYSSSTSRSTANRFIVYFQQYWRIKFSNIYISSSFILCVQ